MTTLVVRNANPTPVLIPQRQALIVRPLYGAGATGAQGPVGPQGPPGEAADAMSALIYDPRGVAADAFDAANLTGVIDGGVFT